MEAHYEGNLLELQGLSWHDDDRAQYSFSPTGLVTFGFIYAASDIWIEADTCEATTWTDADTCV